MPMTQIIHVYHLLKAAVKEVESNLLKSTINVDSKHLWVLVEKQ